MFLSGSLQSGLSVKRGGEICLNANISGSPYPEITWYWNNQVIRPEALRKRPDKPLKKKVEKKEEEKKVSKDAFIGYHTFIYYFYKQHLMFEP